MGCRRDSSQRGGQMASFVLISDTSLSHDYRNTPLLDFLASAPTSSLPGSICHFLKGPAPPETGGRPFEFTVTPTQNVPLGHLKSREFSSLRLYQSQFAVYYASYRHQARDRLGWAGLRPGATYSSDRPSQDWLYRRGRTAARTLCSCCTLSRACGTWRTRPGRRPSPWPSRRGAEMKTFQPAHGDAGGALAVVPRR